MVTRVIRMDAYWQTGADGQSIVPVTTDYVRGGSMCSMELGSAQLLEVEPDVFMGTLEQKRHKEHELFLKRFTGEPKAIAAHVNGVRYRFHAG